MKIEFVVPGDPIAKARVRDKVVITNSWIIALISAARSPYRTIKELMKRTKERGPWAQHYADPANASYQNRVILCFKTKHQGPPAEGPVHIYFKAYFPFLKSWSKKKREEALSQPIEKFTNPDGDNLEKNIWDALNKVAFNDDGQVSKWGGEKLYSEYPRVEITIDADFQAYDMDDLPF